MDLDDLLQHYFGSADIATLDEPALERACERIAIDFGTARDGGRRFALWALLHALGSAPDPATAFKDPAERKAAEDYAWAAERIGRD
ncbi:MAG: hypothetical protein JWQ89_2738 [Devosia sp.]|uniref:hypothetical protein n=1 Tax=Devosia sp. TaxID=1871048 RepID=UPI00261B9697|nr:hypothetical protein [Devosia sp.]MDB5541011.1 hypothetical protein [Devosia sp.]